MCSLIRHGRKSMELQKWRNFSVSVQNVFSALSYSFSSASTADVSLKDGRKGKHFTVSYLVNSLGFTTKLAESISKKVSFEDKANPDSVLSLLRSHGFTDSHISSIITNYPGLLILNAEKSIAPKLKALHSRGASSSELTQIVSNVPEILGKRGSKTISTYYDFIKEITEAEKSSKLKKSCLSLRQVNRLEIKIRNLSVLRKLGVPQRLLFPLLISDDEFVYGKEKFEESLNKVVEMGFDPTTYKFVEALRVFYGLRVNTIEEKVNIYKRLGFAEGDVWEMFKKCPVSLIHSEKKIRQRFENLKKCGLHEDQVLSVFKKFPLCINCLSEHKILNYVETFLGLGFSRDEFVMMVISFPHFLSLSAETVKRKTEFVVKKMNWPIKAVISHPQVLSYSLEKRIVPRCNVIKALISKGLLEDGASELPPISVFARTDQVFLNRYVMKHDELVPELMAIFTGKEKRKTD